MHVILCSFTYKAITLMAYKLVLPVSLQLHKVEMLGSCGGGP